MTTMGTAKADMAPSQSRYGVPSAQPADASFFMPPASEYPPELFQFPSMNAQQTGDLPFDPAVFEALLSVEPLSTSVGPVSQSTEKDF
jgi:hypothetical protein